MQTTSLKSPMSTGCEKGVGSCPSGNSRHLPQINELRYAYDMKLYGSLDNYIAMYRRNAGLSQAELATLVGLEQAALSRCELGQRTPDLEVVLALEMVLDEPLECIFAGVAGRVRARVAARAQALLEASNDEPSHENFLKLGILSKLAHPDDERIIPWEEAA